MINGRFLVILYRLLHVGDLRGKLVEVINTIENAIKKIIKRLFPV